MRFDVEGTESKQFEAFANYSIYRAYCADSVDPSRLIYDGDDPGIDGCMTFVDDKFVNSKEEVEDELDSRKRDADATIVFTQVKTSESWSKSDINTFQSAILDFLSDEHSYPHSEYLENCREIFDSVLSKVGKIRNGKPNISVYFVTTAREATDREILGAKNAMTKALEETGYFNTVKVELIDRDSIVEFWKSSEGSIESSLKLLGNAPFPAAPGIAESYVVTVKAKDFIDSVLSDKNGKLRQRIFDQNVRDFIGLDSEVNVEMAETLQDELKQKRFGILNNGITIIAPDVRVTGFDMYLRDFQIVNGCQTSHVLFEHASEVSDDATLVLKIAETSESAVSDDIVRSTNRQSRVEESQFLATLDAIKSLERYFDARAEDVEYRLFFERRTNQFSMSEDVKAIRVFDIREIARCVAAMFIDKPDIASRYPNRLTGEMQNLVFDSSYREEIYYVAAYTLYRMRLLIANRKIDSRFTKLRWHILMAIKYYVCGDDLPSLSSKKIDSHAEKIYNFVSETGDDRIKEISGLCHAIVDIDEVTRDKVKGPSLVGEVKAKALALRNKIS